MLTEKNPRISGPMQFKPMLFEGQLYYVPDSILRALRV